MKIFKYNNLIFPISAFLFVYAAFRAIILPPYLDEVSTFYFYIKTADFLPFISHLDANNHFLNSLFSFVFYRLFGDTMFVLRLTNLLSILFYIYFSWKLSGLFRNKLNAFFWFTCINFSLYIFSFFSLCRGYGLSLSFLIISFYFLLEYLRSKSVSGIIYSLFFASLSLWSNLSFMIMILCYGSMIILLYIWSVYKDKIYKKVIYNYLKIIVLFIIPVAIAISYSFCLSSNGSLYYGLHDGFYTNVVLNLIDEFSNMNCYGLFIFYTILIYYLLATILVFIRKRATAEFYFFQLLFWLTIIGTILMCEILNVNYPSGRTAIHFYILFITVIFITTDSLKIKFISIIGIFIPLLFLIQFVLTFNVKYVPFWKSEGVPKSFYNYIKKWEKDNSRLAVVSADYFLTTSYNNYIYMDESVTNFVQPDFFCDNADFVITNTWTKKQDFSAYDTVLFDNDVSIALLKRRNHVKWSTQYFSERKEIKSSEEFIGILDTTAEKIRNNSICLGIRFISFNYGVNHPWVSINLFDTTGVLIFNKGIEMSFLVKPFSENKYINKMFSIDSIPGNAGKLSVYFWNLGKNEFKATDLKLCIGIPE